MLLTLPPRQACQHKKFWMYCLNGKNQSKYFGKILLDETTSWPFCPDRPVNIKKFEGTHKRGKLPSHFHWNWACLESDCKIIVISIFTHEQHWIQVLSGLVIKKILRLPFGNQVEKYNRQMQIFSCQVA